jgi:hypothetical protein
MALEISVIEESRAPDVACSSLLDVTAKPHSQGRFLGELTFGLPVLMVREHRMVLESSVQFDKANYGDFFSSN